MHFKAAMWEQVTTESAVLSLRLTEPAVNADTCKFDVLRLRLTAVIYNLPSPRLKYAIFYGVRMR